MIFTQILTIQTLRRFEDICATYVRLVLGICQLESNDVLYNDQEKQAGDSSNDSRNRHFYQIHYNLH